jgi:hypothetical protein
MRIRTLSGKPADKHRFYLKFQFLSSGHPISFLEQRVPSDHPLRAVRQLTDTVLRSLSAELDALYAVSGRPSIAPEYILRALLLQVFFSIRSERLLGDTALTAAFFAELFMDTLLMTVVCCYPIACTLLVMSVIPSVYLSCSSTLLCAGFGV